MHTRKHIEYKDELMQLLQDHNGTIDPLTGLRPVKAKINGALFGGAIGL